MAIIVGWACLSKKSVGASMWPSVWPSLIRLATSFSRRFFESGLSRRPRCYQLSQRRRFSVANTPVIDFASYPNLGYGIPAGTARRWCAKFSQTFANRSRRRRPRPGDYRQ
jgi:hypothetical protein